MKVFFTIDALINAGTERSILDIVSNFSKATKVTVIYFYPRHDLKEAYEAVGIRLLFMDLKGKKDFINGIKKLSALIRKEKPDLLVSSILRANIISRIASRRTNTKLVGTFVSDSYSIERQQSFSFKRRIGAYIYYVIDKLTARVPVAWIANSESIRLSNCKHLGIDPAKVKVVYRGRDSSKFPLKINEKGNIFRFVFVGRLLETKGLTELVEAMGIVAQKIPNISLDIYGGGIFRKNLSQIITASPVESKITVHGAVMDGWKKLYEADCFVFPSWYEGFSGSLVEAMMVGIPVIASDIPMNLEAVTDGSTALVHKVKDAKDLSLKMLAMIIEYPAMKEMSEKARKEAFRRFDIKVIARQYESILNSIANNSFPLKGDERKSVSPELVEEQ